MEKSRQFFYDDEKRQPREVYWELMKTYSLYNTHPVNINTAPAPVRKILSKIAPIDINAVEGYLYPTDMSGKIKEGNEHFYSKKEEVPFNGSSPDPKKADICDIKCHLLRVTIMVYRGPVSFMLEALVSLSNDQSDSRSIVLPSSTEESLRKTSSKKDNLQKIEYPFKIIRLTENSFI